LPLDAKIIEVGTAFGRDASYIENQGYKVERTDATEGFVDWLNQNGHPARVFNLISDDFDNNYDLVFASNGKPCKLASIHLCTSPDTTCGVPSIYSCICSL
jgi:hypothetical protein